MILDRWCQQVPQIGAAYQAKEGFYKVFDAPDSGTAWLMYQEWLASLPPEMVKAFEKSIRAFENWRYEVLRVKMLFSDGLPKAVPQKVRKNSFSRMLDELGQPTEYLGADISTLVERLEKGQL